MAQDQCSLRSSMKFNLRRLLFWFLPLLAICFGIASCQMSDPLGVGGQTNLRVVAKGALICAIVLIWSILVVEDRWAIKHKAENDSE
jgi:hypothetical protein